MKPVYELPFKYEIFPQPSEWSSDDIDELKSLLRGELEYIFSSPKNYAGCGKLSLLGGSLFASIELDYDEPEDLAGTLFCINEPYAEQVDFVEEFLYTEITMEFEMRLNQDAPVEYILETLHEFSNTVHDEGEEQWSNFRNAAMGFINDRGDEGKVGVMR